MSKKDLDTEQLATYITIERIRCGAPIPPTYHDILNILKTAKSKELECIYLLLIELPRALKHEYKEPCLTCLQTFQIENIGYCSECAQTVKGVVCELWNRKDPYAIHTLCEECCNRNILLM